MEVKVCKICNRLFQCITGESVCPKCKQAEEEQFQIVKDYLYDHRGDTLSEVCSNTGVSVSQIQKFLRQGRLQVASDSPIQLTCEICGKRISTGKYCALCMQNLTEELNEAKKEIAGVGHSGGVKDEKAKMRFFK